MLGSGPPLDEAVALDWSIICLIGGVVLIVVGARAGGLALLGAVVGAVIGMLGAAHPEQIPQRAMVGATIGTFVGGLVGLAWKPSASAYALRALGSATILAGAVCVLAAHLASRRLCRGGRVSCLPEVNGGSLALFALDAAWVAALCFIQAARSRLPDAIEPPVQTGRQEA
jgi:hypothetical protein